MWTKVKRQFFGSTIVYSMKIRCSDSKDCFQILPFSILLFVLIACPLEIQTPEMYTGSTNQSSAEYLKLQIPSKQQAVKGLGVEKRKNEWRKK